MSDAQRGETIIITKHGEPVARLCPIESADDSEQRRRAAVERLLQSRDTLGGISVRELIDEGRRY